MEMVWWKKFLSMFQISKFVSICPLHFFCFSLIEFEIVKHGMSVFKIKGAPGCMDSKPCAPGMCMYIQHL